MRPFFYLGYALKTLRADRNRTLLTVLLVTVGTGFLAALENVELPLRLAKPKVPGDPTERATSPLETVGLSGRLRHRPNQLSGGEQQRVALESLAVVKWLSRPPRVGPILREHLDKTA